MRWKDFDGALNSDILIGSRHRLVKGAGRKIYPILDNLRLHHGKPVKAWLAELKHELEVFYLHSYSPELNLHEMANADLNRAVTKLAPACTKLQLVKAAARHLSSVQRQPERIRSQFQHEQARDAARVQ
jgi:transposase